MGNFLRKIDNALQKVKIPDFVPILCAGVVACILFVSLFVAVWVYAAFALSVACVVVFALFGRSEKHVLGFLLFLFPYARIFKMAADSSSLYTYLELVACLMLALRFMRKKDYDVKLLIVVFLIAFNGVLQLLGIRWESSITLVIKVAKNFVLLYFFVKSYKKEDSSFLFMSFLIGFFLSVVLSIFKMGIYRFFSLSGDWNTIWINGIEYLRFSGIYPDPNYFSIQLLLCYAISLMTALNPKCNNRIGWTVCALVLFVLGMLTYSKSYYLMVAVETLFILVFANNRKLSKKVVLTTAIGLVVAVAIIAINPFHLFDGLLSRFLNEDFSTGRFDIWKAYFAQIFSSVKSFIMGAGLDARIVGGKYAHNMYVEALYHVGIIGFIAFAATYVYIVLCRRRKIKRGLVNLVCFGALLVQYFFLNGFTAYEIPYYFMISYIVFNTDMGNYELIVSNACFSMDAIADKGVSKLKRFASKNKLTKGLYAKLCAMKDRRVKDLKIKNMQERGVETIDLLQSILAQSGLDFFFDMGTLLGIIREGKLLGHDLDIDTAVVTQSKEDIENLRKLLIKNGCVHKYRYEVEDLGVIEDSYTANGIKFDVNYYRKEENAFVCYLGYNNPERVLKEGEMSVVKLSCSPFSEIVTVDFADKRVNVPQNAEAYLAERYGENWRVPDKGYIYWKGPSTSPIDNICKQIKFEQTEGGESNE